MQQYIKFCFFNKWIELPVFRMIVLNWKVSNRIIIAQINRNRRAKITNSNADEIKNINRKMKNGSFFLNLILQLFSFSIIDGIVIEKQLNDFFFSCNIVAFSQDSKRCVSVIISCINIHFVFDKKANDINNFVAPIESNQEHESVPSAAQFGIDSNTSLD